MSVSAFNGAGQVVGTEAATSNAAKRGFLWDGTKTRLIPTLGGRSSRATDGYATGQAVGCAQTSTGAWVPFPYQAGTITRIGNPSGYPTGCAEAVNRNGELAGESTNSSGGCRSWRWKNGTFAALPTLSGKGVHVEHLANTGQVVGEANGSVVVVNGSSLANLNNQLPFNAAWSLQQARPNNLNGYITAWGFDFGDAVAALVMPISIIDDVSLNYSGFWAHQPTAGAYKSTLPGRPTNPPVDRRFACPSSRAHSRPSERTR